MEKIYNVSLNLSNKNSVFPLFRVVQGDNITRKIVASLYDENGDAYTPGTGVTAEYWSQKPDRTGTSHSASLSGSTVTITLTEQDTAAVGDVYATVKLIKDEEVLSAIPFRFKVEAFPTGEQVESTSDYQTLVEATEAAEQATADAIEATEAAEQATEYATEAADTASNYNIDLLAEGYDATAIYVKGDYCIYQGALYRCLMDILTPEAWTASHWVAVELGTDVAEAQRDATEGYSDTLTAGDLTSDEYQTDDEPYLFRRTFNGANNHEMDTLVGGTVAWNQLLQNGNFESTSGWNVNYCALTVSDNKATIVASDTASVNKSLSSATPVDIVENHKYLVYFEITSNVATTNTIARLYMQNAGNIIFNPVSLQANTKTRYSSIQSSNVSNPLRIYIYPNQGTDYTGTSIIENFNLFDLTQMFGTTIADAIYAMEQAESGSGVAWFRKYFPESYYAYDAGTLMSVEAVAHRMVGKNLIDDSRAVSTTHNGVTFTINKNSDGSVESVVANGTASGNASFRFVPTQPLNYGGYVLTGCPSNGSSTTYRIEYYDETASSATYDYGSGTTIPIATNGHTCRVVCAVRNGYTANNLVFKPMIRYADTSDTFEPHKQHTYKLSPLTLRGIPKLTDGHLTYDGDTYEPSGQVVRRYGIVDLGTLAWAKMNDTENFFTATFTPVSLGSNSNLICARYTTVDELPITSTADKVIRILNGNSFRVHDTAYTDAATFKASLSGVYVVYILATPTTETASPYEPTQVVYADGTEEYISQNIVPVGHSTKYPISLKSKLNDLPDAFKLYDLLVHETVTTPSTVLSVPDGADDVPVKSMTIGIEPVQSGSGDPSPSNVRPISGWTQAQITRTGKNLLSFPYGEDSKTVRGVTFTVNDDGTVIVNGTATGGDANIILLSNTQNDYGEPIIVSGCLEGGSSTTYRLYIKETEASSYIYEDGNGATLDSGKVYRITLVIRSGYTANNLVFKPMVRLASEADTTYEPYTANTYTVTLPDTVYGGELTVNRDGTGTLVRTMDIVDLGTLSWTYVSGENQYFRAIIVGAKKAESTSAVANILCSMYQTSSSGALTDKQCAISAGTAANPYIYVKDSGYTDTTTFATAMSGVQLAYELATPQIYTLTAPQVRTLLGVNNIWADTGDVIEAVYPCDTKLYVDKKITESL